MCYIWVPIMKKAILFRTFIAFPLFGIGMPDLAFKCIQSNFHIPKLHYSIYAILVGLAIASFFVERIYSKAGSSR